MKFALAGYGSRGDVEPFAAVARELIRRGHDVRLAVPPWLVGLVESAGLTAVPFGSDAPELRSKGDVVKRITTIWAEWAALYKELASGTDLLLTGKSEQGPAANVAEYYGIPNASLHFFPGDYARLGGVLGQLQKQADEAQRRDLGLPEAPGPVPETLEIQAYDELCFPGLPAEWAQQGKRRPFVGALTLELPTQSDPDVLSWIAAGKPPIYFGFGGGTKLPSAGETIAVVTEACAQLGERALFSSGTQVLPRVPRPDHVKVVYGTVNHAAVFPLCRAVVHHAGAGTVSTSLRAGVPILALWFFVDDQPIWAQAVTDLGVGTGREFQASTLDSLVADLRLILAPECATRAREFAAKLIPPAESAARAADALEEAAQAGRSG